MTIIYVLHHSHSMGDDDDETNDKLIGCYSTRENAKGAIDRLSSKPGFREYPGGFNIDEYPLDVDNWTDGFVTVHD